MSPVEEPRSNFPGIPEQCGIETDANSTGHAWTGSRNRLVVSLKTQCDVPRGPMAIELSLSKPDCKTPWGFRLAGGADYGAPLVVVKVSDGGRAQDGGLGVEDLVVRLNDVPTAGLTHRETHEIIHASGNHLTVVVRRGDDRYFSQGYTGDNSREQECGDEVWHILEGAREVLEKESSDFAQIDNIINQVPAEGEMTVHSHQETSQQNFRAISQQSESMFSQNASQETSPSFPNVEGRKWSTFLQRPDAPIPKSRPKDPDRVIEGEPYKVVMKKQPKKRPQFYSDPIEPLEPEQITDGDNDELRESGLEGSYEEKEQVEVVNHVDNNENTEECNEDFEKENEDEEELHSKIEDNEDSTEAGEIRSPSPEKQLTLEERLAQVQRQLEALSQLPSDLQGTLSALTQELKEIVGPNVEEESKIESERHVTFQLDEDNFEVSAGEFRSRDSSEEPIDEDSLEAAAKNEEGNQDEDEEAVSAEGTLDDQVSIPEDIEDDIRVRAEQEELLRAHVEAERLERERLEKIEKDEESRAPPKPYLRPIILPGGRKWSDAGDACPKAGGKKMSDEKIASTLDQYSEVISGKLKGYERIVLPFSKCLSFQVDLWNKSWPWADEERQPYRINFMKYTPPPKNLDYLQRSEVYRLVHDMEPSVRGISTRSSVVLAEEDYYQKIQTSGS